MSFDLPDAIELKKITEDKYSEIVYQNLWWLYKWIQNIDLYRQSIYLSLAITFHSSAKTKYFFLISICKDKIFRVNEPWPLQE
jgi:hypothetical protein